MFYSQVTKNSPEMSPGKTLARSVLVETIIFLSHQYSLFIAATSHFSYGLSHTKDEQYLLIRTFSAIRNAML